MDVEHIAEGTAGGTGALDGRVAAVTGASRGIGKTIARMLAAAGARVALLARSADQLADVAASIGPAALAIPVDIGDPASVADAFATIARKLGRLDVLVNNAAIAWPHRIEEVSDDNLLTEIATNLTGPILTSRSAIPLMRAAGGGDIVNLSSESSHDPFPFLVVYSATKAGLEVFTQGLAHEVKQDGIRVTLLAIGRTGDSEFRAHWDPAVEKATSKFWDEHGFRARVSGVEPQPPERVGDAVLYAVTMPRTSVASTLSVRSFR